MADQSQARKEIAFVLQSLAVLNEGIISGVERKKLVRKMDRSLVAIGVALGSLNEYTTTDDERTLKVEYGPDLTLSFLRDGSGFSVEKSSDGVRAQFMEMLKTWTTGFMRTEPPGDKDAPLMQDSIQPPFYLDYEYGNNKARLATVSAVPVPLGGPVLLFVHDPEPVRDKSEEEEVDGWGYYYYPADFIVWYSDGYDEAQNQGAREALATLGAESKGHIEMDDDLREFFLLPYTYKGGATQEGAALVKAFTGDSAL